MRTCWDWTIERDPRPDAPTPTFQMRCRTCGRKSAASVDFGEVCAWQLHHATRYPDHRDFTETRTRPWRVLPRTRCCGLRCHEDSCGWYSNCSS